MRDITPSQWMATNLATQGYCLSEGERRELWLGLRFSTALCLALVVTGLALGSPALVFLGVIAGFSSCSITGIPQGGSA